ncbi:macro domain-containing protein [Leptotrichia sp. oral taxon 847]|uniref:macro domain-containing protein n=1 Tax=Leptotrichia sp. oral taxon 847 TaxID=1785996 RepID=UPI001E62BB62|nr:macro domain-containing protein [Leptotrichia sp. oral taxon 847]
MKKLFTIFSLPTIMEELRAEYGSHHEQTTSVPMITAAYNLPAKNIIHIVGPIVRNRLTADLEQELADCYTNVLNMCLENNLKSVSFCCISTEVFRFPNKRAAEIAVKTVKKWSLEHPEAAVYACINYSEAFCPIKLEDRSICLDGDIGEVLGEIYKKIEEDI